MNKPILMIATGAMCAMIAVSSSYAATAKKIQQQPPLKKGVPETSAENFNVRKAALVQHVKDTIFRLSIEKSCIKAATTGAALDACQHGAPVATGNNGKVPKSVVPTKKTPTKK